jgi:maltose alpha-D-glucosyltransferase/alpha-amylase
MEPSPQTPDSLSLPDNPLWYKEAVIYEIHVRAAFDSNGDGIGDFRGLTQKLDYFQDLGATALWLLPFYPSPLRDDGYDIAAYTTIHPDYGTLRDFRLFLRAAHRRGIRVITELVLNHTSDQHPWFQRARRAAPDSKWRDYYVWSDTADRYREARVIFNDFESSNWSWDPVAEAYYWHRFYSHQPDLNFDNPQVLEEMFRVVDFWLRMGVDGLRLDAVPYLYEREGTSGENLPETHAFLKQLRQHVDEQFKNRVLLAEANQWPEDACEYFGADDEAHLAFHFPLMPRLFMAIKQEDRFPIIDILNQTPPIPETAQWATFLRNHDELTLEMVTDEDRDYMYRSYAKDPRARINLGIRHRLAPLLDNDRRQIELMKGLLFSLPGTPVLYYGDEIGMGDNIYLGDRNGVRTPMQWNSDRNGGFSRANPQHLYLPVIIDPEYHYEAVNVEVQQGNPRSLLWWVKQLIALRKQYKAFGYGELEFLHPDNRKVLAFLRLHAEERILVVANLSRFVQHVTLDLARFPGMVPTELFGRAKFPAISQTGSYFLTLGPHAFYWLALEPSTAQPEAAPSAREFPLPTLSLKDSWRTIFDKNRRRELERIIARHVQGQRWFRGKARAIRGASIREAVPVPLDGNDAVMIVLVEIDYYEGEPDLYVLPVGFATHEHAEQVEERLPQSVLARATVSRQNQDHSWGVLYDAFGDESFSSRLVEIIARRRHPKGAAGTVVGAPTKSFSKLRGQELPESVPLRAEQSNTSVVFGDRLLLKLFRRVEEGINPDLEMGRFLTAHTDFKHVAPVAGALEYRRGRDQPMTLAILHGYVRNEGDAWQYTLADLDRYVERVLTRGDELPDKHSSDLPLMELVDRSVPAAVEDLIGQYLSAARQLGQRTAQLHAALASATNDQSFIPEAFTIHYQRALYQSLRTANRHSFDILRRHKPHLQESDAVLAEMVMLAEDSMNAKVRRALHRSIPATRIRIHGDYHLGQLLHTGTDFVVIDFEGEPNRPLSQRRMKRCPLVDVAGMIRSFSYASTSALRQGAVRPEDLPQLQPWAHFWYRWVAAVFLAAYLETTQGLPWLPSDRSHVGQLLDVFLIEKAAYELGYELGNRPDWVGVPLRGLLDLAERPDPEESAAATASNVEET